MTNEQNKSITGDYMPPLLSWNMGVPPRENNDDEYWAQVERDFNHVKEAYGQPVPVSAVYIPPFDPSRPYMKLGSCEKVNPPSYYAKDVQPIDLINAFNLGFSAGCIVKYACRAGRKEGEDAIKDLKKIIDYANFEIKRIEDARKRQQANP